MTLTLGLGTAQFGSAYGISNQLGRPTEQEVSAILAAAIACGIRMVDTAPAYGDAEALIGMHIPPIADVRIVTKMMAGSKDQKETARDAFFRSLADLRCEQVYGLLAHQPDELLNGDGVWALMSSLKREGYAKKIGASVYEEKEIDALMSRFDLDLIQVPLNLLDQRMLSSGKLAMLAARGVEVHARSVFLQGLLLMPPESLGGHFATVAEHLKMVHGRLRRAGHSAMSGALAFLDSCRDVTAAVVGVNAVTELTEVSEALKGPRPVFDFSSCAWRDEAILDPRRWP